MTQKQIDALQKIATAGGSLEFYGKSSTTGRRISPVLINGNCAGALQANGLVTLSWSTSGLAQVATLTDAGRATVAELQAKQAAAIPALTAADKAERQTQTDATFLAYLTGTLIPDLHDSGRVEMVEDFERCVAIIKRLQKGRR